MIYGFGDYELDTQRRELCHMGTPLHLEPQVFDLLAYLIQHHNRLVSRDDLHAHLWPNEFVSESALLYCIAAARRAIGDTGKTQRLIKTMRGRGYCFIAPVQERPAGSPRTATPAGVSPLPEAQEATVTPADAISPAHSLLSAPLSLRQHDLPVDGPLAIQVQEALRAERRQLTVLWCRWAVSPLRSEPLDAEEFLQIFQDVERLSSEAIEHFAGHIARHFSTGCVVYFGYPQAHEDDARRAVHTSLALLQAVQPLAQHLKQQRAVEFAMHVGIDTGLVVLGSVGSGETRSQLAVGDAPQIAAQLANIAAANTVVISPATLRLIEGYFVCHTLGVHLLDEPAEPLALYQVLQASNVQGRINVMAATGLTTLVAREHEVGLLHERWEQSKEGRGQVVCCMARWALVNPVSFRYCKSV